MTDLKPQIGEWYKLPGKGLFEVVAIDEDAATIEVQDYDGTVDQIDTETWEESLVAAAGAPEDWTGSLDIQKQDYAVDYDDRSRRQWDSPLEFFEDKRF